MKNLILALVLLLSGNAHALIGTTNYQLFDLTSPSGANIDSAVIDVSQRAGYSIYCDLTGSMQFTGTILVSSQKVVDPLVTQTFTTMTGSTQLVTTNGFMWDVVNSKAGFIKLRIGTFSGAGTVKCYLTAKDI